jgi:hypothetical protein
MGRRVFLAEPYIKKVHVWNPSTQGNRQKDLDF